jgi:hypothetical protein
MLQRRPPGIECPRDDLAARAFDLNCEWRELVAVAPANTINPSVANFLAIAPPI